MLLRASLAGAIGFVLIAFGAAAQESAPPAQGSAPPPANQVEMIKQTFAASMAALRQYEWVETVALSIEGEEKSRQQSRCYYGAEGKLQKTPIGAPPKEEKKRGLRGKKAESKKAELQASLKGAMGLIQQYVPPDAAKIEAAKAAGNVSISMPAADGSIRVTVKSYLKPGDEVAIDVDGVNNRLKGLSIASFVEEEKSKNPVTATVAYAAFPDGTTYPAKEELQIASQKMKVNIENTGYKKLAP